MEHPGYRFQPVKADKKEKVKIDRKAQQQREKKEKADRRSLLERERNEILVDMRRPHVYASSDPHPAHSVNSRAQTVRIICILLS